MPKKDKPAMLPTVDHLVRTVSGAARHVGAFYSGKGIQDEATYGRSPARPGSARRCSPGVAAGGARRRF